jgi:hypothetical protein
VDRLFNKIWDIHKHLIEIKEELEGEIEELNEVINELNQME